jgi:hypothetical protein
MSIVRSLIQATEFVCVCKTQLIVDSTTKFQMQVDIFKGSRQSALKTGPIRFSYVQQTSTRKNCLLSPYHKLIILVLQP